MSSNSSVEPKPFDLGSTNSAIGMAWEAEWCEDDVTALSVTNGAELVIDELYGSNLLDRNERVFYLDTDGKVDELLHINNEFLGFRTGFQSERDFFSMMGIGKGKPNSIYDISDSLKGDRCKDGVEQISK